MGMDNSSDESIKDRPALGDITNRVVKRGFSLLSSNLTLKSGDGSGENVTRKEGFLQFPNNNQLCLGLDNPEKKRYIAKCVLEEKGSGKKACVLPHSWGEINSLRGNIIAKISNLTSQTKDAPLLDGGNGASKEGIALGASSFDKNHSIDVGEKCESEGRVSTESTGSDTHLQQGPDGEDDAGVDNLVPFDCSKFLDSQESRCVELEQCVGSKGDGCSSIGDGFELIKACPCSLCTQASYMWLDLNYQDITGRIAALKKSRKEAILLVQKSCRKPGIDQQGQYKSSKLESDLEGQWKSLFLRMEDMFVRETSELETNLLRFKDLRESYKAELESINGMPSGKQ